MYRSGHIITSLLVYITIIQYCYFNLFSDYLLPIYLIVNVFGALTPDIDIYLRRIVKANHRSLLTHSALIPLVLGLIVTIYSSYFQLYLAFSLGISAHLISDIPGRKTINRLSIGWSRIWLLLNSIVSLPIFSYNWLNIILPR